MAVDPQKVKEVRSRLAPYDIRTNSHLAALFPPGLYPHTRRCATLVPLFVHKQDGELHVLLTQRASTLRSHASNVAFPGGVQDASDKDDTHTALREAEEEIGLDPSDVTIIAHLPPLFVGKCNSVYPVVGFIPSDFISRAKPNPTEVALVFSVPLRRFVEKDVTYGTYTIYGTTFRTPFLMHVVTTKLIRNDAREAEHDVSNVINDVGVIKNNDRNDVQNDTSGIGSAKNGARDKIGVMEIKNDSQHGHYFEVKSYFDDLIKNYAQKAKNDTRNVKSDVAKVKGEVQGVVVEESTPVLVWGATANICVAVAVAILQPQQRLRMLVKTEDQSSSGHDLEDDGNVFGNLMKAFHLMCKATMPSSRL